MNKPSVNTVQLINKQSSGLAAIDSTAELIAACLRKALTRYESSEFIKYLVVPSPVALTQFFNCTLEEIQEALEILQSQGYDYDILNPNIPLTLWDPTVRTKTRRHYPKQLYLT